MKLPEELLQKLKKSGYTKKEINILREQKAKKFYFVKPRAAEDLDPEVGYAPMSMFLDPADLGDKDE